MSGTSQAYRLEIHLHGGTTIVCDLPATDAQGLAEANFGLQVPDEPEEARAIATMIYTLLLRRMDKGTGFYQLTDLDGRQWVIRADTILAFNLRPPRGSRLGFQPLAELPST